MIKYEARFEPINKCFMSGHIKGWQIMCDPGDGREPYPIALCVNNVAAQIMQGALNHAVEIGLPIKLAGIELPGAETPIRAAEQ